MVADAVESGPSRDPELDRLKALSIVAVVIIHSLRPLVSPQLSALERFAAVATQFAVPCFLMCSGYLYARPEPEPWRALRRRLLRLLGPYLVASLLAGMYRERLLGQTVVWPRDLLLGNTFGAYYYVFVIVSLVLVTPLIARLPGFVRMAVSAFLIASSSLRSLVPLLEVPPEATARLNFGLDPHFPWHLRHPLLVWGYFFFGWEVYRARAWLSRHVFGRAWPRRLALALLGLALCAVGVWSLRADVRALILISWPLLYLTLLALCLLTFERTRLTRAEAWLSRQTYFIYLYHLFFVLGAQRLWPQPAHAVSQLALLAYVAFGLLGPCLLALGLARVVPAPVGRLLGLGEPLPAPVGARP